MYLDLKDPVVMGILNITPDSFSDGGLLFKENKINVVNSMKFTPELIFKEKAINNPT